MTEAKSATIKSVKRMNMCVDCACPILKCAWLAWGKPVEGWDAEKVLLNTGRSKNSKNHIVETYKIYACPLYVTQRSTKRRKRGAHYDPDCD